MWVKVFTYADNSIDWATTEAWMMCRLHIVGEDCYVSQFDIQDPFILDAVDRNSSYPGDRWNETLMRRRFDSDHSLWYHQALRLGLGTRLIEIPDDAGPFWFRSWPHEIIGEISPSEGTETYDINRIKRSVLSVSGRKKMRRIAADKIYRDGAWVELCYKPLQCELMDGDWLLDYYVYQGHVTDELELQVLMQQPIEYQNYMMEKCVPEYDCTDEEWRRFYDRFFLRIYTDQPPAVIPTIECYDGDGNRIDPGDEFCRTAGIIDGHIVTDIFNTPKSYWDARLQLCTGDPGAYCLIDGEMHGVDWWRPEFENLL